MMNTPKRHEIGWSPAGVPINRSLDTSLTRCDDEPSHETCIVYSVVVLDPDAFDRGVGLSLRGFAQVKGVVIISIFYHDPSIQSSNPGDASVEPFRLVRVQPQWSGFSTGRDSIVSR